MDIGRAYHHYDGFVVCMGTDTMAYAASALSFMLENLGKTVRRAEGGERVFEEMSGRGVGRKKVEVCVGGLLLRGGAGDGRAEA